MKWSCALTMVGVWVLSTSSQAAAGPPITAITITPDGQQIVTGSQAGLFVREASTLSEARSLNSDLEQISAIDFSPTGDHIAVVGGVPGESGAIEVYSWPAGERVRTIETGEDVLYAVDWSADGRSLAAVGFGGTACMVSVPDGLVTAWESGHSRGLTAVCLLPRGTHPQQSAQVVTGSIDQTLRVTNLDTGEAIRTLHNHTAPIHGAAVRPNGEVGLAIVASNSDDHTVRFWQPTIGRMMRFLRLESVPLCLTWTHTGTRVVAGCADGQVCVINPETARLLSMVPVSDSRILSIAAHPTQDTVFVGTAAGEVLEVPLTEN